MVTRTGRIPSDTAPAAKVRLLVADDHPVVRLGLRRIVEPTADIVVVAEAATASEALRLGREEAWDLMVMNLSFPDGNGLEVLSSLRSHRPEVPILVFSMHVDGQLALRALRGGASGFISKDSSPEVVLEAIRRTAAGRRYVSGWLAEQLVMAAGHEIGEPLHARLSEREFQVMLRLAGGQRPGQIADALALSVKTVSTYRTRIVEKLGVSTNAEIAAYAIRHQLLD
jgi:DNA-binding NarL/FixJ family response regulator